MSSFDSRAAEGVSSRRARVAIATRVAFATAARRHFAAAVLATFIRYLFAGLAVAATLTACGFHLRGDVTYPFSAVYINSPSGTPLAFELKRTLEGTGAHIADEASKAQVTLDVVSVNDDKQVLSLSGGGRVREYALTKRVSFQLHDADGHDWLPAAEIVVRRTYSFNESEVLARESQEGRLLKEMQTDAVQQVVRRLQAAKRPV